MPKRIAVNNLNASTIDIINTIRANASQNYQQYVPEINSTNDIPRVGEVLYGYPALANEFVNALVNRIALVRINGATFNNMYADLKKGYLEFGETVEEVFVNIAKAREFSAEKAEKREFKRTLPDVRSAFHAINWRVQYPITIQNEDIRMAFMSAQGVQDLIAKIVDSVYRGAEYDEFLLFKYLIIKAVSHGKMYPVSAGTTLTSAASAFRAASNKMTFLSTKYNASGVHTNTAKSDQHIFMDSDFNAEFDVNVLASAFNMDKADFLGRLRLIDDFTTFDNERFDVIREGSDQIEPVTADELTLMSKVKAVLVDAEWFQIYDNLNIMTEDYVAAGLYWNYFYNVWKTVSTSPFSNAIVFVADDATIALPGTMSFTVSDVSANDTATVITLEPADPATLAHSEYNFVQTQAATQAGIAVHKYGAIIVPTGQANTTALQLKVDGTAYNATAIVIETVGVGDTVTFTKAS